MSLAVTHLVLARDAVRLRLDLLSDLVEICEAAIDMQELCVLCSAAAHLVAAGSHHARSSGWSVLEIRQVAIAVSQHGTSHAGRPLHRRSGRRGSQAVSIGRRTDIGR